LAQQIPVELAERVEPAGVDAVVSIEVVLELAIPTPVEIDDRLNVALAHHAQQTVDVGRHPARVGGQATTEVRVRVDRRRASGGNAMLR
jgi:hypothetical protein